MLELVASPLLLLIPMLLKTKPARPQVELTRSAATPTTLDALD
jgi:hypothetical protein